MSPTLSIVLGTLNRLPFLQQALPSIPKAVGKLSYEMVVVDGGSTDGTLDWLRELTLPDRLQVIAQGERLGAVDAFNTGFRFARGEYVAAFNDDAEYFGVPLEAAVGLLRSDSSIGQVAIPFMTQRVSRISEVSPWKSGVPEVANVNLPKLGKVPYANFGVIARALGDRLGWWGDYYQYAGDTHLSTSVWAAGLRVAPLAAAEGYIVHYEAQDETRLPNVESPHFTAIWHGPNSPLMPPSKAPNPVLKPSAVPVPVRPSKPLTAIQMRRAAIQRTQELRARERERLPKVKIRYCGNKHGNVVYQRPGGVRQYVVDAVHRDLEAEPLDAEWMLALRSHGKGLFEKAEDWKNG